MRITGGHLAGLVVPAVVAAVAGCALVGGPAYARTAASPAGPLPTAAPAAGMPAGVPPAATAAEPTLPAPPASVWPFGEHWSRTEGTGRLAGGASFWTDYVYDDHGAGADGLPIGVHSLDSSLAPTQGVDSYPTGPADGNGADVFRTAVGLTADAVVLRVDWDTLADPTVPAAEWVWATGADPTVTAWPANAGVRSAGVQRALFVSSRGAYLTDPVTGAQTRVADTSVDLASRSFVVSVPRSSLDPSGTWTMRMGAGLADAAGTAFTAPVKAVPTSADNLMNVTFRTAAQEPPVYDGTTVSDATIDALGRLLTAGALDQLGAEGQTRFVQGNFWDEDHQADALQTGDVSDFSLPVDWSQLAAHATTAEPQPTGYSNRWYVTPLALGQGAVANDSSSPSGDLKPNLLGRVQPYAVYVPTSYRAGQHLPLTWVLHSLSVDLNQYGAYDPQLLQQLCEDRDSICATTEGFGPDLWYFDDAEVDYWDVWHQLADTYGLDPARTVVGGYSMGGWAAYKLGLEHPDLYAQAYALEGPPTCGVEVASGARGAAGSGHCGDDGLSVPVLGNARWLPYSLTVGAADELVPVTSSVEQTLTLQRLGYRYHAFVYPTEDHLVYAVQDRFGPVAATVERAARTVDPGRVDYDWFPDTTVPALGIGATTAYWMSGLAARTQTPGQVASLDATSAGRPDPAVTTQLSTAPVTVPTPGTELSQTWSLGARPAARDALSLTLADVSALTVDAPRAGLRCPVVTVRTDGATRLTLTGLATGTRTYAVPAGSSALQTCSAAGTSVPTTAAGRTSGELAFTGGGPTLPLVATGLVAAGAAVRLRRR